MPAPERPRHSCECICSSCEAQGAGYFAQRAALTGDRHAAERLSPAVFTALAAERGRRHNPRKPAGQASARLNERGAYGSL